jgi:hypothetical protein
MNPLLKLTLLKNLSHQHRYLSTSPILHSWFVKLTNVTQVNTEAAVPKHTRKRNYPLTCTILFFVINKIFFGIFLLEKMNKDNFLNSLDIQKLGIHSIHRIYVMENVKPKLLVMIFFFVNLFMVHGIHYLHRN